MHDSQSEGLRGRGRPRNKKKRRGYSADARRKHPGISIAQEPRAGELVLVMRWKDLGTGKWKKSDLRDAKGKRVTSRRAAERLAIVKSKELEAEKHRISGGGRATNTTMTWSRLIELHTEELQTRNRSPKTIIDYKQAWRFLGLWSDKPRYPHQLVQSDLERFVRLLRSYRGKGGKALSPHSIAATTNHLKVLLNFGRKKHSCVRLDAEMVTTGLDTGKLPQRIPTVLNTEELNAILETAKVHDKKQPDQAVYPFLYFLITTGCRRGEAEKFRFTSSGTNALESWCDFGGDRIVIWDKKRSRHKVVSLKTRPGLKEMLQHMQECRDIRVEPYVFGGKLPLAIGDKREKAADGSVGKSLKSALYKVRDASGVKYKLKDLRSTNATYVANSDIGSNLYSLAGELGHDYAVLVKHYANHRQLPPCQRQAATIEGVLGLLKRTPF